MRFRMGVLAVWLALGLLETIKNFAAYEMRGDHRPWDELIIGNVPWWLFWAALTPLVFRLCDRFPFEGGRWKLSMAVHALASFVIVPVHTAGTAALFWFTNARGETAGVTIERLVTWMFNNYVVMDYPMYWTIVLAWVAVTAYRKLRERELEAARLTARAATLEAGMTEARLEALRHELNPHFLFNALNAVSGLVRRAENDAATLMLARLGDLLRLTLGREARQEIPLARELEFLDHYLGIEQVRFRDRLTVERQVSEEARELLVPPLMLQPLVENAVRHGVARSTRPARIVIRAHAADDTLTLEVEDTGQGFPGGARRREGVGLSNTRSRLFHLYGDRAGLRLENLAEGGCRVTLTLPARHAPAELEAHVGD